MMKKVRFGFGFALGVAALVGCSSPAPTETSDGAADESAALARAEAIHASIPGADGRLHAPEGWMMVDTIEHPSLESTMATRVEQEQIEGSVIGRAPLPGGDGPHEMRNQCAGDRDSYQVCCYNFPSGSFCCTTIYDHVYCDDRPK